MTELLIVVVNYFSSNQTCALIKQIGALASLPDLHILCIDNSCDEKEAKRLKRSLGEPQVSLQINTQNLGYGAAINHAVRPYHFERLLILNPDVTLEPDTITNLYQFSREHPSCGLWGGVTVKNDKQDFRHAWRDPSILRNLVWSLGLKRWLRSSIFRDDYRFKPNEPFYPVDAISGCCMLISNNVWQTLSGFDERFFLYSEEVDLCYRARTLGYKPSVSPSIRLQHAQAKPIETLKKLPMIFTGKVIFAEKHFSAVRAFFYRQSLCLGAVLRSFFFFLRPGCEEQARAWQRVARDSLLNRKAY